MKYKVGAFASTFLKEKEREYGTFVLCKTWADSLECGE